MRSIQGNLLDKKCLQTHNERNLTKAILIKCLGLSTELNWERNLGYGKEMRDMPAIVDVSNISLSSKRIFIDVFLESDSESGQKIAGVSLQTSVVALTKV